MKQTTLELFVGIFVLLGIAAVAAPVSNAISLVELFQRVTLPS